MRRIVAVTLLVLGLIGLPAGSALASDATKEAEFISLINDERTSRGLSELIPYWDLTDDAWAHSDRMAAAGDIWHNPDLGTVTSGWYALGENVGMGPTVGSLHTAFMDSAGHRANVLGDYNYVGVGVTVDEYGTIFVTVVFMRGPAGLPGTYSPPFWDDDGSVHEPDIVDLWESSVTVGCDHARYCPDQAVTRAQTAAFFARSLGLASAGNAFRDDDGHQLEDHIDALASSGITRGCGVDLFCPEVSVTRAQMAAFLARALDLSGGTNAFSDDDGHPLESDIDALAAAGITDGCAPGRFCPDDPVTRAQVATFLVNAFGH